MEMPCKRCGTPMHNWELWFYNLHKDKLICRNCTDKNHSITKKPVKEAETA